MTRQTVIRDKLAQMQMTVSEAAQLCGITPETMGVLHGGSQTLPSLAARVARGLGLTSEEARQIGHALDLKTWRRRADETARGGLDFDPLWYEHYNRHDADKYRPPAAYLAISPLAEWCGRHCTSVNEVLKTVQPDADKPLTVSRVNYDSNAEVRADIIRRVAEHTGMSEAQLSMPRLPNSLERADVGYVASIAHMEEAQKRSGKTNKQLGAALGCGRGAWQQVRNRVAHGSCIHAETARAVAKALGVDFYALWRPERITRGSVV